MRPEIKNKLDKELKRAKRKPVIIVTLSFFVIGVALTACLVPLSTTIVYGESVRLTASPTWKVGNLARMIVRLNEGRLVRAKMSRHQSFIANKRVELHQGKTLIGYRVYRLVRYADGT